MEVITKLRDIRKALIADGVVNTSSKELEALRTENEALKKQNEKNVYRIKHLAKNLEAIEYSK